MGSSFRKMFSRLSQRIVASVPRAVNFTARPGARIVKAAFGSAAIIGMCTGLEVQAKEEEVAEGADKNKILLAAAGVAVAAGVGVYLMQTDSPSTNVAFVFVKPHACTDAAKALVKAE